MAAAIIVAHGADDIVRRRGDVEGDGLATSKGISPGKAHRAADDVSRDGDVAEKGFKCRRHGHIARGHDKAVHAIHRRNGVVAAIIVAHGADGIVHRRSDVEGDGLATSKGISPGKAHRAADDVLRDGDGGAGKGFKCRRHGHFARRHNEGLCLGDVRRLTARGRIGQALQRITRRRFSAEDDGLTLGERVETVISPAY